MSLQPASNRGLANLNPVLIEEGGDRTNALPFSAKRPDDLRVVIQLGTWRIRFQAVGRIEHLLLFFHGRSCRAAGNAGKLQVTPWEMPGDVGKTWASGRELMGNAASPRGLSRLVPSSNARV